MASHGIRDRVAIVGMGCTPFGEHWDKGADDLVVDATVHATRSAGVAIDDAQALLRAYAFAESRPISDVARDVVGGAIQLA